METGTEAQTALFGQFGQTLAFAERTLTATLREHLAQRGVVPETWYALKLIGTRGPGLSREALTADLDGSRRLGAIQAAEVLARMAAEGLITGDERVDLTAEGDAFYRDLREYVAAPAFRLLSQFDIADIETTIRTLRAVTEQATERAA